MSMTPRSFIEALLEGKTVIDKSYLLRTWKLLDDQMITVGGTNWPTDFEYLEIKKNTININGFEVPEPEREALCIEDEYYDVRDLFYAETKERCIPTIWDNDVCDFGALAAGTIHLKYEDALIHCNALKSFTEVKSQINTLIN